MGEGDNYFLQEVHGMEIDTMRIRNSQGNDNLRKAGGLEHSIIDERRNLLSLASKPNIIRGSTLLYMSTHMSVCVCVCIQ